ncbi:hypothetical protein THRCLA_20107 [Thraustotheca clavata]|uniref:Uncharacterized protein n=1 Tax=Thraustotheca clavata TaxID=74557 RepID=A0A1W0ABD1_9STRA|nr:hypothetical protein THRCLA_20107 [Thraustotheca clavata]
MTDSLLWRYVTEEQVLDLGLHHTAELIREYLEQIFSFPPSPLFTRSTPMPKNLLLDMYMHLYAFIKQNEFPSEKASTLLGLLHSLVLRDMLLLGEKDLRSTPTISSSFNRFQALILQHSVERPPMSMGIFTASDVNLIVEYITNSYYRHFHLYQSIFIPHTHLSIIQVSCMEINRIKPLPPLQLAIQHQVSPQQNTPSESSHAAS